MMSETLRPPGKHKSNGMDYFYGDLDSRGLERPMEPHCRVKLRGKHPDWELQPQSSVRSVRMTHTHIHTSAATLARTSATL